MNSGVLTVKNMESGEQKGMTVEEILREFAV
jgi:histidyl-tRNA synthetase